MNMAKSVRLSCYRKICVTRTASRSNASLQIHASAALRKRLLVQINSAQSGVGVSITVTPCWCYGTETMDMDPSIPKAVWGFNGTERPGAVYLAAVLSGYAQKGLPAFGIYGEHVQDAGDTSIPDRRERQAARICQSRSCSSLHARQILSCRWARYPWESRVRS